MNNLNSELFKEIFSILEKKFVGNKVKEGKKDSNRSDFNNQILKATNDISMLGLKYPNFITTPNDKISTTLYKLDKSGSNLNIDIFIPSSDVLKIIDELNIYPKNDLSYGNVDAIQKINNNLQNININIYEYNKYYGCGISAIDLEKPQSIMHISKAIKNKLIKNAPYFYLKRNTGNEYIFQSLKNKFDNIKNNSKKI